MILIILGILVIVVLYLLATYNKFVSTKTRIKSFCSGNRQSAERQANLIPNLVSSVKGYMKHEKQIFKDLTDARKAVMGVSKSANPQKMIDASAQLQQALAPIRVVLESNPELKAAGPTSNLMEELRDTADKVMYSRRTLIDLTADYNIMVVTVPSNIVASVFSFKQLPGLKMPEGVEGELKVTKEEMKSPKVEL